MLQTLIVVLVLAALFVSAAYARKPFWGWVGAGAGALVAWRFGGVFSELAFWIVAVLFAALAVLFGVRSLRRKLVSRRLMPLVANALPVMSETERAALDAGTVWWDGQLFSGAPDWDQLLDFTPREIDAREREFQNTTLDELCRMLDDHALTQAGDLPPEVWEFIKRSGLMGMIIPREFGGLEFSARMQSAVIARLSSRSVTAAVTVMVPNSLGPAELLLHYGTDAQKKHYLPRLARGQEVPCFALTEPTAGSDAASMRSSGVVCRGMYEGREVLGMRLEWNKRYITLAPVATVIGLAFKLRDPDRLLGGEVELGITCALIPATTRGVEIGERHDPLGVPFMNGPTRGHDVFVPLDFIIGGAAMAGKGWRMLMQCLAAGRGISLPALATGAAQLATRVVGAHGTIREQFGLPLGRFEGVEAPIARIAGLTYLIDSARLLTLGALDAGEKPAVVTAIMKAYTTESMRVIMNDAMDVVGGAGICRGPRNVLAHGYQSLPIGITVEGANILTRSMIIFGQGAIRCHPWVQREMSAVATRDVAAFDAAFWGHIGHVFSNAARSFVLGVTNSAFAESVVDGPAGAYFQKLSRYSAAFAFAADVSMGTLGGSLKRKEALSGRLADALAWLYLGSATLKRYVADAQNERDTPAMRWALEHAACEIENALDGLLANHPQRLVRWFVRPVLLPLGRRARPPSDRLASAVARSLIDGGPARLAMTPLVYLPAHDEPGLGMLEGALEKVVAAKAARERLKEAQRAGLVPRGATLAVLDAAVEKNQLTPREAELIRAAEAARDVAIQVDAFAAHELAHAG